VPTVRYTRLCSYLKEWNVWNRLERLPRLIGRSLRWVRLIALGVLDRRQNVPDKPSKSASPEEW